MDGHTQANDPKLKPFLRKVVVNVLSAATIVSPPLLYLAIRASKPENDGPWSPRNARASPLWDILLWIWLVATMYASMIMVQFGIHSRKGVMGVVFGLLSITLIIGYGYLP